MRGWSSLESIYQPTITRSDLVLMHGGGNFGDIWKEPHEYKKMLMRENPMCKFILLPQTVWYYDLNAMRADAEFFAGYNCTICARDQRSYELLKNNFKNEILLVPDMAFCMDMAKWNHRKFSATRPLVLKRSDKEFHTSPELAKVLERTDIDIEDWTTMSPSSRADLWRDRIRKRPRRLGWAYEPYMYYFYRPYLIRSGIRQLMTHTDIYTTRLHACILSILLGKEKITFFDNSYGKNSGFYETWLRDCENVKMVYG